MNRIASFERGVEFINYRRKMALSVSGQAGLDGWQYHAVAIARESASGAHAVGEKVAEYLQTFSPADAPRWTVFDRNLVERVLSDHRLPRRLAKFMPEDATSAINDIIEELFGLHPPSELLVRQTSETILRLAKLGRVILLGRASVLVTAGLPNVLRVRLVAPLEQRIQFMQESEGLDYKQARERVHEEDHGRRRYFRRYFHKDDEDPLLYHLVLNTGLVSFDEAAQIIGDEVRKRAPVPAGPKKRRKNLSPAIPQEAFPAAVLSGIGVPQP